MLITKRTLPARNIDQRCSKMENKMAAIDTQLLWSRILILISILCEKLSLIQILYSSVGSLGVLSSIKIWNIPSSCLCFVHVLTKLGHINVLVFFFLDMSYLFFLSIAMSCLFLKKTTPLPPPPPIDYLMAAP